MAYLIGPVAFLVILLLMRVGYTARESAWTWLGVFAAIVILNLIADHFYEERPNTVTLNLRVMSQVAAVTAVIYLTGWGPVLWGAYAFIALENVARGGSRVWRTTALWSLVGMVVGQFSLTRGWLPSELTHAQSTTMTVLGAFMLLFVIRMAGAIMEQKERLMEQKEEAEATLRMSEDRFRSLIQNSSDVTMILDEAGDFRYVSPAIRDLLQYDPDELVGSSRHRLRPPGRSRDGPEDAGPRLPGRSGDRDARVPHGAQGRDHARRGGGRVQPDGSPVGRRVRVQHPGHHRAQEVRGACSRIAPCTTR